MMAYHQGRLTELDHWLNQMQTIRIPGEWAFVDALRGLLAAAVAIAEARYIEAEDALRQITRHQERVPTSTRFGSARSLLAHLYLRWGQVEDALTEFAALLAECERQGMPGRALLEGAAVVPLLRLAVERNIRPALAAQLLNTLGFGGDPLPIRVPDTGETLTSREIEVLRLLAAGASNRQIAEQLVVTEHTVKSHVSHVLRKLNVPSRAQAIALTSQSHIQ